jgi:hypothetical protein
MRPPMAFHPGCPMYTALMNGLPIRQPIRLTTPSAVSTRVVGKLSPATAALSTLSMASTRS